MTDVCHNCHKEADELMEMEVFVHGKLIARYWVCEECADDE